MNLHQIAHSLGGAQRNGDGWLARCPCHKDRSPSLSLHIKNNKILVRCFSGCNGSDIMAELKWRGLLNGEIQSPPPSIRRENNNGAYALDIWRNSLPFGSRLSAYLSKRGYTGDIPRTLRYHPALRHPDGKCYPAMVAGVCVYPSRKIVAIHRTYLMDDKHDKRMLGSVAGGAVRLGPHTDTLAICEGIETGLSIQQATGLPVWCALSAGNMERIVLPPVKRLLICADNDSNGVGQKAAAKLKGEVFTPPNPDTDFNDYSPEEIRGIFQLTPIPSSPCYNQAAHSL